MVAMRVGDRGFFYHSSSKPPGIVGICEVVREAYPDFTQFDPASDYYDPNVESRATQMEDGRRRFVDAFPRSSPSTNYARAPTRRHDAAAPRPLSVQPVEERYWNAILAILKRAVAA